MVAFEQKEKKIVITLNGDRDDYIGIYKCLLFMMGNQNPETLPDTSTLFTFCNLLEEMLPASDQIV